MNNNLSVKRNFKDSVFTNLFGIKKYTLQVYKELCPNNEDTTEDDIEIVTLENVLANRMYNDLGMVVSKNGRKHSLIMIEAQSTWSTTIVYRMFLYAAETYKRYTESNGISIYRDIPELPKPKFYVLYTGKEEIAETQLSLSELMLGGVDDLDMKVNILQYKENDNTILYQYTEFTRIADEVIREMGRTEKALKEILRRCLERGILVEYLTEREKEVINIMSLLYDDETIRRIELNCEREEGMAKGIAEGIEEMAQNLRKLGMPEDKIREAVEMSRK